MSNRTLVELNHDYAPGWKDADLLAWAKQVQMYLGSGDKKYLPQGVTFVNYRHHSTPCPLEGHGDPR